MRIKYAFPGRSSIKDTLADRVNEIFPVKLQSEILPDYEPVFTTDPFGEVLSDIDNAITNYDNPNKHDLLVLVSHSDGSSKRVPIGLFVISD